MSDDPIDAMFSRRSFMITSIEGKACPKEQLLTHENPSQRFTRDFSSRIFFSSSNKVWQISHLSSPLHPHAVRRDFLAGERNCSGRWDLHHESCQWRVCLVENLNKRWNFVDGGFLFKKTPESVENWRKSGKEVCSAKIFATFYFKSLSTSWKSIIESITFIK